MPIGSVDYISTIPWNDPLNPFPLYAQVIVSMTILANGDGYPAGPTQQTLTMSQFVPEPGNESVISYVNAADIPVINKVILRYEEAGIAADTKWYFQTGDDAYRLAIYNNPDVKVPRAIPAGYVQGNVAWDSNVDVNIDVTTLSIMPVTTYLTPWEQRRRRLLETV